MTFDPQVQTITQDHIVPKITDQTLSSNVITLAILSKGRPWIGESLKFSVKTSSHTQGGSFDDYSEFNYANENVRKSASFDPRGYYQSCVIGGIAKSVNAISKTQLLNLVKVEMESVHMDMVDDIGSLMYGDGTGNSNRDFLGLDAAVDNGAIVDTYGGISRAADVVWKAGNVPTIGAFDFTKARSVANAATVGNQKPDVYVCDETTFGYIETDFQGSVEGNYNVIDSSRGQMTKNGMIPNARGGLVGQAGFDYLYYAGAPIVKDDKADAQKLYALNTEYLRWYGVKAADANPVDLKAQYHDGTDQANVPSSDGFAWTGFVRPHNQYSFVGQFLLLGNLVCPSPRLQAVGTGITS